jgi:NitT/TauT family transport system substrate-binding protein
VEVLPEMVSREKGFFAARGLDVTMQAIPNGGTIPAAVLSGSVQVATYTGSGLLQAVEGGLDFVAVMAEARSTAQTPGASLVYRTDFAMRSPADLKGRNVGVSAYNNVLDMLLRKWLLLNHVQPADVHIIETPFPAMMDLLRAGRLDAATVIDPFRGRILQTGVATEMPGFIDQIHPDMVLPVVFTTRAWFDANRAAMANFRDATRQGIDFIAAHPDEARQVQQKYLNIMSPSFPSYDVNVTPDDLRVFEEIGRELGMLKGDADLARIVPTY